jgi:putative flippase GtrA
MEIIIFAPLMPKKTITRFIDFFYPPFRKIMPLQTFRYAACGGSNVALGFLVYTFTYHFILHKQQVHIASFSFEPYSVSLCVSSAVTFLVGFLLNKYVVFIDSNVRGRMQLLRYSLSLVLSLSLNYILLKAMVGYLHINAVIAQFIATIIVIAVSYITQRHFTFKVKKANV